MKVIDEILWQFKFNVKLMFKRVIKMRVPDKPLNQLLDISYTETFPDFQTHPFPILC